MVTNFSRFVANWYRGCEVIATRFDSIDSLRIELCKAESFHRKSIFLVYKYGGCEVTAIRFDSIDSLRIEPCKSNRFTGSRYSRYTSMGGVKELRSFRLRVVSPTVSSPTPTVVSPTSNMSVRLRLEWKTFRSET